jgi:hypothetical protein
LRNDFRREHVRERQVSVLKNLLSQKSHLPLHPSLREMPHPWASLPTMGVLPNLIYAREALFAYVISPKRDMRNLCAIRLIDRRWSGIVGPKRDSPGRLDAARTSFRRRLRAQSPSPGRLAKVRIPSPVAFATSGGI